ncbi:MAG: FAD-dependent oxidoreductase [Thermoleophilia bacterium]|nr:FAD-dependent oxidoreductase [Thermoleophilia bacterium]
MVRTITTEIAVMGSGIAGLTAAVKIAQAGVRVAVFEKRPFQGGGVSNTPMMTLAVRDDPAYQDKAFKVHMEYTNYSADAAVVMAWIKNSSHIPEFLQELGFDFLHVAKFDLETLGQLPGYTAGFPKGMHLGDYYFFKGQGKGHGGALICKRMADTVRKLGGEIYFSHPVKELIREGDRVVGLVAEDAKSGEEVRVNAKAVIVASGGFSDNREMIKKYTGFTYTNNNCDDGGNVLFNTLPGARLTGDGQQAVWAIGGARGSMGINGHNLVPGPGIIGNTPWIQFNQIRVIQEQPYLWVNQMGERFIDEGISNNHMAMGTSISRQPGKCAYLVFDEATVRHMEQEGLEYIYFIFPAERLTDVRGQFEHLINVVGNKHVFLADTIEELCAQTGIDVAGLKSTLEAYNRYCDQGHDDQFAKDPRFLRPVREPKFYALRCFCGGYQGLGGIKINGRCEVVDDNHRPIKGLYAAGDCCAGEIWGDPPTGGIGTSSISFAQGFVSAREALKYVQGEPCSAN